MRWYARVHSVRDLSRSVYILRFERADIEFVPGQWLSVGSRGDTEAREYSIFSGTKDPFFEILVREIATGSVSPALRAMAPGTEIAVEGPSGSFLANAGCAEDDAPHLFVATGTGISPFHSLLRSGGAGAYQLLHGVRYPAETYGHDAFSGAAITRCVTRPGLDDGHLATSAGIDEPHRLFRGRVTDYLQDHAVPPGTRCFLCGNADMIYETIPILLARGVPRANIDAEIYF